MDFLHHPDQSLSQGFDRAASGGMARACRAAGAVEVAINFGAGKGDLFANQMAQRRIFGLCGVGHDGERCLDGVGEVAGLQASAFGKFAVVL